MKPLTIAEQITVLRRRAGLTQTELAEAAGVSFASLVRLEASEMSPRIDQLEALAVACGAKVAVVIEEMSAYAAK